MVTIEDFKKIEIVIAQIKEVKEQDELERSIDGAEYLTQDR